jgi:hypothetical protein
VNLGVGNVGCPLLLNSLPSLIGCHFSVTNKCGANGKNYGGLVTVKRQRQTPNRAVSSTTRKNLVSELIRESLITPRQARNNPPAPGWESKRAEESKRSLYHWISPTRKIQFKRHRQAREFEDLRFRYGPDEVRAWEEYRKLKYGQKTFVVTPHQYDRPIVTKNVDCDEMCYICNDGGGR